MSAADFAAVASHDSKVETASRKESRSAPRGVPAEPIGFAAIDFASLNASIARCLAASTSGSTFTTSFSGVDDEDEDDLINEGIFTSDDSPKGILNLDSRFGSDEETLLLLSEPLLLLLLLPPLSLIVITAFFMLLSLSGTEDDSLLFSLLSFFSPFGISGNLGASKEGSLKEDSSLLEEEEDGFLYAAEIDRRLLRPDDDEELEDSDRESLEISSRSRD